MTLRLAVAPTPDRFPETSQDRVANLARLIVRLAELSAAQSDKITELSDRLDRLEERH